MNPTASRDTSASSNMAGGPAPTGPSASPLGQAWGYGIVLGIGFLFALGMVYDNLHVDAENLGLTMG